MSTRKTSTTVRRALARALALSMPAWAAAGCNIGTAGGCSGPADVYAPQAVDAGVPACRDDFTRLARVPACDDYCGKPVPGTLLQGPCCMSLEDPGVVSCPKDCTGRRPAGFAQGGAVASEPRSFGALFARMAFLERASIDAFRILEGDLRRHRAPRSLVHAARRAKRDEHRHFRTTRALARRDGTEVPSASRAAAVASRSLEAIAIENAREGCVREAFGALIALWQARAAEDAHVRAAMTRIAREEASHAALAWSVHGWAMGRLGPQARRRVEQALREEAAAIACGQPDEPDPALARSAGLPTRAQTRRLASTWIDQFLRRPHRA